jgi:sugar phosphate isomerase/epimerase
MDAARFGMDTITLNGGLEAKLAAMKAAGFTQVMILARDIAGHLQGEEAAIEAILNCGMRITGLQVLRDFEGLSSSDTPQLHDYKIDIAKAMLRMAAAIKAPLLLVCSSTHEQSVANTEVLVNDLRKLAMLALPLNIKIAYEALSWGKTVHEYPQALDIVLRVDRSNLGLCLDAFHMWVAGSDLTALELINADKIAFVQLSDYIGKPIANFMARRDTARSARVFPGEGAHSASTAELVRTLERMGYRGDYSFEVFNDDYQQLPLALVCQRAAKSVAWVQQTCGWQGTPLRRS